jgi:hypothetical protein
MIQNGMKVYGDYSKTLGKIVSGNIVVNDNGAIVGKIENAPYSTYVMVTPSGEKVKVRIG